MLFKNAGCGDDHGVHELSVAQSLVELIEAQLMAAKLEGASVAVVRVAVGEASAVVPGALRSAWGPASATSGARGATLVIESVPVVVWCEACAAERTPVDQRLVCPVCGARTPTMVRGKELELLSLEFADDDDTDAHTLADFPDADGSSSNPDAAVPRRPTAADSAGAAADPEEQ